MKQMNCLSASAKSTLLLSISIWILIILDISVDCAFVLGPPLEVY